MMSSSPNGESRRLTVVLSIINAAALLYLIAYLLFAGPASPNPEQPASSPPHLPTQFWPGWTGIEHLIVFGDSYSATSFDPSAAPPSHENPLGNPAFPGQTSSNGPNWVDFLSLSYNATFIQTLNFAWGGATVDLDLISRPTLSTRSFKDEYEEWAAYKPPSSFDWRPETSLFAIWIGINDIPDNPVYHQEFEPIFEEFAELVEKIYQTGARNFLFLNVPAVYRSPRTFKNGVEAQKFHQDLITAWNLNVTALVENLSIAHTDTKTFIFDTNKLFNNVIDDPCSYPETCMLKNTTWYCDYYVFGTADWYTYDQEHCDYSVDKYLWLNDLHPTFRIHNATAREIAKALI